MQKYNTSYWALPLLTFLTLLGCLIVFTIPGPEAGAAKDVASYELRMAVDSTVLPLVENPDVPLEEENVSVEPLSSESKEESAPVTVIPHQSEKKSTSPAVVVTPKPTPKAAPKVEAKPAPRSKAVASGKGEVRKVTLESTNKRFVITVYCDRPVGDTSYLNLSDPKRFVLDLRQPWVHNARNVIRSSKGQVKHVITGNHSDRFRLVVHFRTPPKGRLVPRIFRDGNKLVVVVPTK